MKLATPRTSSILAAVTALAVALPITLATRPAPAQATGADLITDHVVQIHETVSDAGFVHPGIGLSAEDLRTAQTQVRAGVEPWASYFEAMTQVQPWAGRTYDPDNMVDGQPDVVLTPNFDQGGLRSRMTRDAFGAMTQAILWVVTGDEAYRRNAMWTLRTWSNMNPEGYVYFADAHIHTGHPLYQFLLAAEIIRATDPVDDDSPGTYDGYDTVWHAHDDEKLLGNFANPIVEVFNFSNERYMNQHNFGLFGRIATAIYADDAEGYATGVEWFTVNSAYGGHDNGAIAPLFPVIDADHPANTYGYDFVQIQEMGRDQAHAECDVDNFTGLARIVEVQGTRVDPEAGTVSTAPDAVSVYEFGDNRILHGADAFAGFMMGAEVPWVDTTDSDIQISQAYRGRLFNHTDEIYLQYRYAVGVDVEAEAPWIAELHERWDGPLSWYGTGVSSYWAPGDKNPEYWVAFPSALADTAPPARADDHELTFARHSLQLDDGTTLVTEDGRTFARAHVDESGTTSVMSRMMYGDSSIGVLLRSDGPATLEVLPTATGTPYASVEIPDTQGQWRYVTYPPGGTNTHFYRISGEGGVTVDLHQVSLSAGADLAPPQFEPIPEQVYLAVGDEAGFDFSLAAASDATFRAGGLPQGASVDPQTGRLAWTPGPDDIGRHTVQLVADDGGSVAAVSVTLVVAQDRDAMIDAALAAGTDPQATYTTLSAENLDAALTDARDQVSGSAEQFRDSFSALEEAIAQLELLNPTLTDGTLDFSGHVTASVISSGALAALVDGDNTSTTGDLRQRSFVLDFGPTYRVQAEAFGIQARALFPNRSQGTNVYGSQDGVTWTLLTEHPSSEISALETIDVLPEHRDERFRYLKVQVDEPGVPTDPAYPGIWTIAELRVHGERFELPGVITDVSITSPQSVAGRVVAGDDVELAVTSRIPLETLEVQIAGEPVTATSDDGLSWTAATTLGAVNGAGPLNFAVDHVLPDGSPGTAVVGTTDFTSLFASDERTLVDLAALAQVIDADGEPDAAAAAQAAALFDADQSTHTDLAPVEGEAALIWDLQSGGSVRLERIELLLRQDNNGLIRVADTRLEGSNDLQTWVELAGPAAGTHAWQNLDSGSGESYRYLRLRNSDVLGVAELRLAGSVSVDLDALIARARDLDLSPYSRASAILFAREIEAAAAAAEDPDTDRDELADRLLAAWDLLETVPATPLDLAPEWVVASSPSWDGRLDAAANGWAMFDGDPSTFTDTTSASGWVRVAPGADQQLTFDSVRVLPRSSHPSRASGIQLQISQDQGQTWTTVATVGTVSVAGWVDIPLEQSVSGDAFRVLAQAGNTNLAEVELIGTRVDVSALELYLTETAHLRESDWTVPTWQRLADAREAAATLLDDAAASQASVDGAATELGEAIDGLEHAEPADTARPSIALDVAGTQVQVSAADDGKLARLVANLYDETNAIFVQAIGSTSASTPLGVTEAERTWQLPAGLAPGTYTIRASASDLAGNIAVTTTTVTIPDITRPSVDIEIAEGTVTVTASDAGLLNRVAANLYDEQNQTMIAAIGSTSASQPLGLLESIHTWPVPSGLAPGTYVIRAAASDLAGLTGVTTLTLEIPEDTE